jgi:hypothetical protein
LIVYIQCKSISGQYCLKRLELQYEVQISEVQQVVFSPSPFFCNAQSSGSGFAWICYFWPPRSGSVIICYGTGSVKVRMWIQIRKKSFGSVTPKVPEALQQW